MYGNGRKQASEAVEVFRCSPDQENEMSMPGMAMSSNTRSGAKAGTVLLVLLNQVSLQIGEFYQGRRFS